MRRLNRKLSHTNCREYFLNLGYEPADRQTTPDFLVSVTDPLSRIQRAGFTNVPRSAEEFARTFRESELGALNRREMDEYEAEHVARRTWPSRTRTARTKNTPRRRATRRPT